MNPLVQQFLGSVIRWLLTFIGAWMVQRGIVTGDQATEMIAGFTVLLVALAWSLWQKWKSKREANTQGAMKQGATLDDAKASIARGIAAPASVGAGDVPVLVNTNTGDVVKPPPSNMGAWLLPLLLTGSVLTALSCGSMQHPRFPELSPEGKVAVIGRQLVAGVSEAATQIDLMITAGSLTKEQGVAVLTRLRPVGVDAQKLADELDLIDQAKTEIEKTAGIQRAAVIVRAIQKRVSGVGSPAGSESTRDKIAGLLGNVADLLITISLVLPSAGGSDSLVFVEAH